MAITNKTLLWNDDSGDYVTITYNPVIGNTTVTIRSDENRTKFDRTMTVTVKTTIGSPIRTGQITIDNPAYPGDFSNDFSEDFYI